LSPAAVNRDDTAAVDGLRGFAALLVVASHAGNMGLHLIPGLSLAGTGKYGVYLFFVISAYLLTLQWLRAGSQPWHDLPHLARYFWRRLVRIYPLYAVVLCAAWLLRPRSLGVPIDGEALLSHLLLQEGRDIYWSVPVEFCYYLVIPVLSAWLLLRMPAWLSLLGAAGLLALVAGFYPASDAPANSDRMGYYLPVFVCGSLAAWGWALHAGRPQLRLERPWSYAADASALTLLVLSVPAVYQALGWAVGPAELHRTFIGWGVFWALVLLGVVSGAMPVWNRVMRWPVLRWCGRWCFGIYLLHLPVLMVVSATHLPRWIAAWIALLLAIAVGGCAHLAVERPAQKLGRRIESVLRRR
jgi:peptidoglycan/LPS O-acetylase OafA/YrhL